MRRRALRAVAAAAVLLCGALPVLAEIKRPGSRHVEVRGADAMLQVARRSAEGYMAEHPDTIVTASGGGSSRGIKSVLVGTADVALYTGEVPDDLEKLARQRKIKLETKAAYRDAVVVVVHPRNPIADLSLSQVRDIFRGAVTNWKQVGGKDAPIVVVNQESWVGAFDAFKRRVLGNTAVVTPSAHTVPYRELAKAMVEDAIGYVGRRGVGALKVISIDGVAATPESLTSGKYPIQRVLSVAYRADASPTITAYVAYLLAPDKGQVFVREQGDVSLVGEGK